MDYRVLNAEKRDIYNKLINFALDNSSWISFCTFKYHHQKHLKPTYDAFMMSLSKFEVRDPYLFSPLNRYTKGQQFHYYTISPDVKKIVSQIDQFAQWGAPYYPDDISFYTNYKPWLYTVTHETMIFLSTKQVELIEGVIGCGAKLRQL